MTSESPSWRAWHLHLANLGVPATDQVVHRVVGPAIEALRPPHWFFMRYWQCGPHVRLRVADLDDDAAVRLEQLLHDRLDEVLASTPQPLSAEDYLMRAAPLAAAGEGGRSLDPGTLFPPGVYRQAYQPEVDRYGGADLLPISESLFQGASELALAFIRREPPEPARSGLGLRATWAALAAVGDDEQRRRFCLNAGAGWQAWAQRGWTDHGGKSPAPRPLVLPEGDVPAPVRRWASRLGAAMNVWREATGEENAERILHSHIHMLHNRLGLSVSQEQSNYVTLGTAGAR